jgi:hypothetical protein
MCPSLLPSYSNIGKDSYTPYPLPHLQLLYVVTLISWYKCIYHFFFLIALWTFLFHHQEYLASPPLPLVSPHISKATFQIQVDIFSHMLLVTSFSFQVPSLMAFSLKTYVIYPSNFHRFVFAILSYLSLRACI